MNNIKSFFLDDLSFDLKPKDILDAFKSRKRYLKVIYYGENYLTEVDLLRPLFELMNLQLIIQELPVEEKLKHDDYFLIVFNSSIPRLLYHENNRIKSSEVYSKIIKSFNIEVPHYSIYNGKLNVSEEINRYEFIKILTNKKLYSRRFKSLKECSRHFETTFDENDAGFSELKELSFVNLS